MDFDWDNIAADNEIIRRAIAHLIATTELGLTELTAADLARVRELSGFEFVRLLPEEVARPVG